MIKKYCRNTLQNNYVRNIWGILMLLILVAYAQRSPPYTIAEVKELLRKNGIEPGNVFIDPEYELGICNCNQTLVSVASLPDTKIIHSNIVLGYPRSEILNCHKNEIFSIHRILLNQTDTNRGVCKYGHYSRDLSDAHVLFPPNRPEVPKRPKNPDYPPDPKEPPKEPKVPPKDPKIPKDPKPIPKEPPVPPKEPPVPPPEDPKDPKNPKVPEPVPPKQPKNPNDPYECSPACKALIDKIPAGPPGPPGPRGPPGEASNQTNAYYGYAPPRKSGGYQRTFKDIVLAYKKYTGCDISDDEGYLWNVNEKRHTDCKVAGETHKQLSQHRGDELVSTGYVIIWFWNNHEGWYTNAMAYREKENDIVPVLCGHDPSPVFMPILQRQEEDIRCSTGKNPSYVFNYMIYGILVLFPISILLNKHFIGSITRVMLYYMVVSRFVTTLVTNYETLDDQQIDNELEPLINN